MSAWLCENKTLSLVVDTIKSDEFKENYNYKGKDSLGFDADGVEDNEELLIHLSTLNSFNLDCLYGMDDDNHLDEVKYIKQDVSDAQRHMSVCCYIYQTSDYEDMYNSPLFKALKQWRDDNYAKYDHWQDTCKWDIDRIEQ